MAKTDGSNNPNIPGLDNGLNAWLDVNINTKSTDHDLRIDANYAKCNSDRNGQHDIDDVPIWGPPLVERFPAQISMEKAAATASRLMNDDNLVICRKTGMMRVKDKVTQGRKRPASTVVRPSEQQHNANNKAETSHTHRYYNKSQKQPWDDRYYQEEVNEWDSDVDLINAVSSKDELDSQQILYPRSGYGKEHRWQDRNNWYGYRDSSRQEKRTEWPEQEKGKHRHETRRYTGKNAYFSDSASESSSPGRTTRSGINAKPSSNVRIQQRYPHFSLGQVSGFIGQNIQFHNLNYEQFIAGELTTIAQCDDLDEIEGRTELLQ